MKSSTLNLKRTGAGIVAALFSAIMVFMASASMASAAGKSEAAKAAKPGSLTITEIVLLPDGEFDVLQAAVINAGLAGVLDGKKQYTVFAPTDAAFVSSLGVANEAEAIEYVSNNDVTDILLYHVTNGRKTSTPVLAAPSQKMLNGQRLPIAELASAGISGPNVSASNGVIHVIDAVLGL